MTMPAASERLKVSDFRAVFQQGHLDLRVDELPALLLPRKGCFELVDYEKAYCPDLKNGPDVFDLRGVDREQGAIVIVRPDQYVSSALPLDDTMNSARSSVVFYSAVPRLQETRHDDTNRHCAASSSAEYRVLGDIAGDSGPHLR
jgi:hypothetical protein